MLCILQVVGMTVSPQVLSKVLQQPMLIRRLVVVLAGSLVAVPVAVAAGPAAHFRVGVAKHISKAVLRNLKCFLALLYYYFK